MTDKQDILKQTESKYSASYLSLLYPDVITLQKGPYFLDTLDRLISFAEKVDLPLMISSLQGRDIDDFVGSLQKYEKTYSLKMIPPLRTLCLRLFEAKRGITKLHCYFVQLTYYWKLLKQALQIIEYPALPFKLPHSAIPVYYFNCYLIYRDLKRYTEAEQALNYANCMIGRQSMTVKVVKHLIVMNIFMGRHDQIPDILARIDRKQSHKPQRMPKFFSYELEKEVSIEKELEHFTSLNIDSPLTPLQINDLKAEGLLQFYQDGKSASLRNYIKDEIMSVNYRLKASQIKGQCLSDFQVIKGVNKISCIYRYDRQNGIAYFNHKQVGAKEVDEMISKSAGMHVEITSYKQSKEESRTSKMRY